MIKVALVHDYIKEYGGAERVLEQLHAIYPNASVFTLLYAPQFLGPHKERFRHWKIHQSFLALLPFNYKFISIFRIIAPYIFQTFDFSQYDVIIVSASGAYSSNMINKKGAKQICYCHTPPRYLYGYATAREWKKNILLRIFGELANHFLRMVDFEASKRVDIFIANSYNTAARIRKFYRRESVVIYPPVAMQVSDIVAVQKKKKNYYLAGGRLARPKHIDLIIKACNELQVPLKIFGKGFAGYGSELQELAGSTVTFLGEVSDREKLQLMKDARALIFAGEDEDFGIIPVESMSVGVPVISYKSGGPLESVIEGKTGVFFNRLTVDGIKEAIKNFERMKLKSKDCIEQANKFSEKKFRKEIEKIVESVV